MLVLVRIHDNVPGFAKLVPSFDKNEIVPIAKKMLEASETFVSEDKWEDWEPDSEPLMINEHDVVYLIMVEE